MDNVVALKIICLECNEPCLGTQITDVPDVKTPFDVPLELMAKFRCPKCNKEILVMYGTNRELITKGAKNN